MYKLVVYDVVTGNDVFVEYGSEDQIHLLLRGKFYQETKDVKGGLDEVCVVLSKRFGLHFEVWKRVV